MAWDRLRAFSDSSPRMIWVLLVAAASMLLAGCAAGRSGGQSPGLGWLSTGLTLKDPQAAQVYRADDIAELRAGGTAAQTFVSPRSGLDQVEIWLRSIDPAPQDRLHLALYHEPGGDGPVFERAYLLDSIQGSSLLASFPPLDDPPNQAYRLEFRVQGQGGVILSGRNQDVYPQGVFFFAGRRRLSDLGFQLAYSYGSRAVLEDIRRWLGQAWLVLPLLAALWLPGRLALHFSGLAARFDHAERAAMAVGLSLALWPLSLLWTTTLQLSWSRTGALAAAGIMLAAGLLQAARIRPHIPRPNGASLAVGAIFLFALAVRLAMIRDLAAPAWVDSVHHAMIVRLITETGALPSTYQPFLDIETAQYHSGFHSALAFFTWFSGLSIDQAMLIFGQVMNALIVPAVYLLAHRLTGSRPAGVVAALVAGLATPMPAYYTSWGRYTQLTGLLVLPAGWTLAQRLLGDAPPRPEPDWPGLMERLSRRVAGLSGSREVVEMGAARDGPEQEAAALPADSPREAERRPDRDSWAALLLAAILFAGLFLIHYRILAFLLLLLLADLVARVGPYVHRRQAPGRELLWLGAAGLLALALTLPWWPAALSTLVLPKSGAVPAARPPFFEGFSWTYLNSALGKQALALAYIGLGWSLLNLRRFAVTLLLWIGLMFFLANLGALGLPGAFLINNTTVGVTLFIPIAIFAGYLFGWLFQAWDAFLHGWPRRSFRALAAAVGVFIALIAARHLLPILNPSTVLFWEADRPAMGWIEANIPAGETVLVNPFSWGYGLYAGHDGGYWIVPLAGRPTMPPPALYGIGNSAEDLLAISAFCRRVTELADDPAALQALLLENGIRYVYIGARGGRLPPQALASSPQFEELYYRDGTWVLQVVAP